MPVMLYGSSPDALAASQRQYDEMYGNANKANADAQIAANNAGLKNALDAQSDQQKESDAQQRQQFDAWQNALARASAEQNVKTQYGSSIANDAQKQNEEDYRQAVKNATNGALDPDLTQLKTSYPHFTADKIQNLYNLAASAKQQLAIQQANSIDRGGQGQPPDPSLADGLPAPQKNAVLAHIAALRAPYEDAYTKAAQLATAGNAIPKIQAEQQPAQPVGDTDIGPVSLAAYLVKNMVSPDETIQPNPDAVARMAALAANAKAASTGNNATLSGSPSTYAPVFPSSWRPASSLTATAPAAPQNAPPVAMTPPPSSIAPPMAPAPAPVNAQAAALIAAAKDAIAKGAPESAVRQRLLQKYGLTF